MRSTRGAGFGFGFAFGVGMDAGGFPRLVASNQFVRESVDVVTEVFPDVLRQDVESAFEQSEAEF
jgi:hypothetical protein